MVDVVFVVGAVVAIVVFWVASPDNALGGIFFTTVALAAIANTLWEMRGLWPVTGWSADADPTTD